MAVKSLMSDRSLAASETAAETGQGASTPARPGCEPLDDTFNGAAIPRWKRALDLGCLLLALPAVLLSMVFIAVVIKLVSPGPVFFKQERVGYRRQRFLCLKFRTMKLGTDTAAHERHVRQLLSSGAPMAKLDAVGDPRLIPLGQALRASGLDELPQLINVWRGEMSLVGPRPCTTYEFEAYQPQHHARFAALPGLTGLWQVSGKNQVSFTEMIDLDIRYARNCSPWMDLKIMAKTVSTLSSQVAEAIGKGAAQGREPIGAGRAPQPPERV
jgi:exopolysaccharide production protein ExoY